MAAPCLTQVLVLLLTLLALVHILSNAPIAKQQLSTVLALSVCGISFTTVQAFSVFAGLSTTNRRATQRPWFGTIGGGRSVSSSHTVKNSVYVIREGYSGTATV